MNKIWQLQHAKSHLSELVKRAESGEAQVITKHGENVAVVIDYRRYLSLTGQQQTLLKVLRGDGTPIDDLLATRDKGIGREVDLP